MDKKKGFKHIKKNDLHKDLHKESSKKKPKAYGWKKDAEDSDYEEVSVDLAPKNMNQFDDDSDDDLDADNTRKLVQKQNRKNKKSGGFQSMGLSHSVFTGIIRKGYKVPTPIQRKTIPLILDGKDVVAMARTGSGKTAAFLLPMFEKLKNHVASGVRSLILSPTRELALQTLKFTKELGKYTSLRAAVILGGDRMEEQFAAVHESPDIIIATPGRFLHVVMEMDLKLANVEYIVFDEADRLFEMGFAEQLSEVLSRLPESRQTLLFSATLPRLLVDFARAGLHDPVLLRLDVDTKLSTQLKLSFFQCRSDDKTALLLHLLRNVVKPSQQTVVFVATKHHVDYLNIVLGEAGFPCSYSYSALDQTARKINIAKFRTKKTMVLIVTDLAARGIDIPLLENVINYNFPAKPKLFVHRVGRCARAGASGHAYSLVGPDEVAFVLDLHLFLGRSLTLAKPNTSTACDAVYGTIPQTVIDDEDENLRVWNARSDIGDLKRVASNAYKQYIKSRPVPASESVKRAKSIAETPPTQHPLFAGYVANEDVEVDRQKLLDSMRQYRPNNTIFEINSTKKAQAFAIMKTKRSLHGHVIAQNDRKLAEKDDNDKDSSTEYMESLDITDEGVQNTFNMVVAPKSSVNTADLSNKKKKKKKTVIDSENYLRYQPSDYQSEKGYSMGVNKTSFEHDASSATLDLAGDDNEHTKKLRGSMRWDRKRKRFVHNNEGQDGDKKKIRTESGAWIPATYKKNIYKEWLEKSKVTHTQQDPVSDDDTEDTKKKVPLNPDRFQVVGGERKFGKKGRWHTTVANQTKGKDGQHQAKPKRHEMRNKEEILKKRRHEAKQKNFQQHKEKKHRANKARAKKRK